MVLSILASRVPDKPINLANNAAVTTASQCGLTWDDGAYNGGTSILDYKVSYAQQGSSVYTVFASDITTTSATVTGLDAGVTYLFYVQARNLVGDSLQSDTVTILAAQISDAPLNFADSPDVTSAYQIGLQWSAPTFQGGSPVLDYRVWSDNALGGSFTMI